MRRLRFAVKAKLFITFERVGITFLRNTQTTKSLAVPYSGGNGFFVANATILLSEGTDGQVGYLLITVNGDQSITGAGVLNLSVTHYPSDTQATGHKYPTVDNSGIDIEFTYNSKPITQDIVIEVDNRINRTVTLSDFASVSDYDNDGIGYVTIYGADSNLQYNGATYINGTPIIADDINNGKLVYLPDNVDNQYNDDYSYTITDTQGNTSD